MVVKLRSEQAARVVETLLSVMKATSDPALLGALAQGLVAGAGRLDVESATRLVSEALKNPFLAQETDTFLIDSVRKRPPRGLNEGASIWEVLAWGAARR